LFSFFQEGKEKYLPSEKEPAWAFSISRQCVEVFDEKKIITIYLIKKSLSSGQDDH
jgi:hypothetical protein